MNNTRVTCFTALLCAATMLLLAAPIEVAAAGVLGQPVPQNGSRRRVPSSPPTDHNPPNASVACADGIDNDGDGAIDYPKDPGCLSASDTDESNPALGPGNAHRMIAWAAYEKLITFTDAQFDLWKSRGADGFVIQTRYLDEIGGIENWTGDPNDPLSSALVEGADVHLRQRTLRDTQFVQRCHARGLAVYLGFYLSNYQNLSTPLKVWNDDAGWAQILPLVRNVAGAAKLLGADGIATDSENYRSDSQTWNWDYPGVTQGESTVRSLARQRGHQFMDAVLAAFPNVEIINYRIEIPGDWEEKVQLQVNHVAGVWDKSVFPDFWGGIADAGGFAAIYFLDPIFYKSWQVGSGWDAALQYNVVGVRQTLSQRWANWTYAAPRFFISPFAWIDPGPSAGSFDDARDPDYVAAQLAAFHHWGQGNLFGLYTQHIDDFDYTPYVPAMQLASTPDPVQTTSSKEPASGLAGVDGPLVALRGAAGSSVSGDPATIATAPIVSDPSIRFERVALGFHEPMDSAFTPDGRLFIAERAGAIRIVRRGRLNPVPAGTIDDVWTANGNGVLAIAIDPYFDRTHLVYVLYTATSRTSEPVFRLARLREVGDTLGDRAVLADLGPAAPVRGNASLRFGPDEKLYVALDAGGDVGRLGQLGASSGKILRMNPDGTTPSDQPIATPVYAYGYNTPGGFDWQPQTGAMWIAGRDAEGISRLRAVVQSEATSISGAQNPSYILPGGAAPSSLGSYRGDQIPWLTGALLVAVGDNEAITVVRFDRDDPTRVTAMEPLLQRAGGVIRTLAVAADGAIYLCVNDELVRLVNAAPK